MVKIIDVTPKMMSTETIVAKIDSYKRDIETNKKKIDELEEELELRKQEVPLGVPAERRAYKEAYFVNCTGDVINQPLDANDRYDKKIFDMLDVFNSEASAEKHKEMLLDWRKALVANAKGEQIDIRLLIPLIKKGWVAMDDNKAWYWFSKKPEIKHGQWMSDDWENLNAFNLKPADDWRNSLMECGL